MNTQQFNEPFADLGPRPMPKVMAEAVEPIRPQPPAVRPPIDTITGRAGNFVSGAPDVPPITGRAGDFVSAPGAITPQVAVGPATVPSASTAPSVIEMAGLSSSSGASGRASAVLSVARAGPQGASPGTQAAATIELRLSEHPADIQKAARALSKAIADQIDSLRTSNGAEVRDFIDFLQEIAKELDALADLIDRAIGAGSVTTPEPILLGKAAEIARNLGAFTVEGIERNRAFIQDCTVRIGLAGVGLVFLQACGAGEHAADFIAKFLNVKPKE